MVCFPNYRHLNGRTRSEASYHLDDLVKVFIGEKHMAETHLLDIFISDQLFL